MRWFLVLWRTKTQVPCSRPSWGTETNLCQQTKSDFQDFPYKASQRSLEALDCKTWETHCSTEMEAKDERENKTRFDDRNQNKSVLLQTGTERKKRRVTKGCANWKIKSRIRLPLLWIEMFRLNEESGCNKTLKSDWVSNVFAHNRNKAIWGSHNRSVK